jgi:hypothetical protein
VKYEKPSVRDLSGRSASGGPPIPLGCFSGTGPTEQCATGEVHAGLCNTGDLFGGAYNCTDGTGATDCIQGNLASID